MEYPNVGKLVGQLVPMKEAPRMDSSGRSKNSEWVLKLEMAKMTKTKRKYSEDNAVTSLKWNVRQTTDDVVKEFMCVNVWRQLRHSRRTMTSLVGRRDCHVEKRLFPTRMSDNIKKTILPSITSWRQWVVYNAETYDVTDWRKRMIFVLDVCQEWSQRTTTNVSQKRFSGT